MLGIICALQRVGPTWIVENKPMVWMGKISYGVYVYHLPMLLLGNYYLQQLDIKNTGIVRPLYFVLWIGAAIALANLSYRRFEIPILGFKDYWKNRLAVSV